MRSFDWLSVSTARARIGRWFERARQSLLALRPVVRWSLAAGAVSIVILAGYLATSSLAPGGSSYLASGRRFSPDDLVKVRRALEHQRIDYRTDDQRRVAVSADEFELASAAIAKLELGPRSLDDLRDLSAGSSLFESPQDRELRQQQRQEKILESLINELPGIVGSFVWINRPRERWGLRPSAKPTVFVSLETEEDRQLPFRTIQSITTNLTGSLPGLSAEAITVVDRRGHKYLDAGNPALSALSHSRAREEELSQEILLQLDWIRGVRVSVQLPGAGTRALATAAASESSQRREPAKPAGSGDTGSNEGAAKPRSAVPPSQPRSPSLKTPSFAINHPLTLDPPPLPPTAARPAASNGSGSDSNSSSELSAPSGPALAVDSAPRENPVAIGRVWVKVPRSYYITASTLPGHKEPSQEDLQKLVSRTEDQIRTGLALVVPMSGPLAWKTTIDLIPDEVPSSRPPIVSPSPDSRRLALDWGTAGALGALAAAVVTLGVWLVSARRPTGRIEPAPGGLGLRYDRASGTIAPSERVREFVRRNPESARSVLERWTSQGVDPS
jgi:flagellar M-ring protein FliF